jgi:hypothetical protein
MVPTKQVERLPEAARLYADTFEALKEDKPLPPAVIQAAERDKEIDELVKLARTFLVRAAMIVAAAIVEAIIRAVFDDHGD